MVWFGLLNKISWSWINLIHLPLVNSDCQNCLTRTNSTHTHQLCKLTEEYAYYTITKTEKPILNIFWSGPTHPSWPEKWWPRGWPMPSYLYGLDYQWLGQNSVEPIGVLTGLLIQYLVWHGKKISTKRMLAIT